MLPRALCLATAAATAAAAPIAVAPWPPHRRLDEACPFCASEFQVSCSACVSAGGIWQAHQEEEGVAPCDASCDDWGGPSCVSTLEGCSDAAPPPPPGPCAQQLARIDATLAVDPSFRVTRPSCDEQGGFLPVQCSGSTGYCWCSSAEGVQVGKQVRGQVLAIESCLDAVSAAGDDVGEIDCEQAPCLNGGWCADRDGGVPAYECQCVGGFSGTDCEIGSSVQSTVSVGGRCAADAQCADVRNCPRCMTGLRCVVPRGMGCAGTCFGTCAKGH